MPDTGLSPSVAALSKALSYTNIVHIAALQPQRARPLVWPPPRSLATTCGITFVFFSSSYLDVSVRRVDNLCSQIFNLWGSPIRTRADQSVVCTYPRIFAAYRVLRRPQEPRHPPCALIHFLLFVQRQIFGYQNFLDQFLLFTQITLCDLYYYILPTLSMNFYRKTATFKPRCWIRFFFWGGKGRNPNGGRTRICKSFFEGFKKPYFGL